MFHRHFLLHRPPSAFHLDVGVGVDVIDAPSITTSETPDVISSLDTNTLRTIDAAVGH